MGTRNRKGRYERTIEQARQDTRAVELHAMGWSYESIAGQLGWANKATAYRAVQRAIAAVPSGAVDELRRVETRRLLALIRRTSTLLVSDDELVVVAAVREIRRCSESLRRLHGADAPVRHDVKVSDALTDQIEQLAAELAGTPAGATAGGADRAPGPAGP